MKSLYFIDQAINILEQDTYTKERYSTEIDWLIKRREKWSTDKIRIGVLGVTSSGKSTLINAVLGDKLLSMAVKPSSSQLVSCFKGAVPEAVIYFQGNNANLSLRGDTLTLEGIKKYSDESVNKGNKEKVTDILLKTPRFDLGNNVVLIDSAGLDAYKLEVHERLSLEVLLPTIDLCVLVTTLKTNSDAKTKTVLNAIARHKCPLLIVQNMLDSVEPSPDGSKTKGMVAEEHKKRLQRIVDDSQIEDKETVKIIQMSAIYAMRERCDNQPDSQKDSNYKSFRKTILSMVKTHLPHVEEGRIFSVFSYCSDLIDQERKKLSSIPVKNNSFQYKELNKELKSQAQQTVNSLFAEVQKIKQLHETLINGTQRKAASNDEGKSIRMFKDIFYDLQMKDSLDDVRTSIEESKRTIKQREEQILKIIAKFNDNLHRIATQMNYPLRDLSAFQRINNIAEPREKTKTVTRTRKIKKGGPGGWFARGFGKIFRKDDWGYEYESYTEIEFDEVATEKELLNYVIRVEKAYESAIKQWQKTTKRTVDQLQNEIDLRYESYLKLQKKIEQTGAVERVIDLLEKMLLKNKSKPPSCPKQSSIPNKTPLIKITDLESIQLTPYQYGLMHSARLMHRQLYKQTLRQCKDAIQAPANSVVIGWDIGTIESFSIRFLGIAPDITKLDSKRKITIDGTSFILSPDSQSIAKILPIIEKSIYILVNAHQDGSAKNQISNLELTKYILPRDRVFLVIQEIDSLIECDGLSEMRTNLAEYYQEFGFEGHRGLILINDDNPIFNLAFCQNQIKPCNKHTEEIALMSILKEKMGFLMDNRAEKVIADLIRSMEGEEVHEGQLGCISR